MSTTGVAVNFHYCCINTILSMWWWSLVHYVVRCWYWWRRWRFSPHVIIKLKIYSIYCSLPENGCGSGGFPYGRSDGFQLYCYQCATLSVIRWWRRWWSILDTLYSIHFFFCKSGLAVDPQYCYLIVDYWYGSWGDADGCPYLYGNLTMSRVHPFLVGGL